VPLACVINNWIEVRSDAVKLCTSRRRPIPQRADSIGPWLDNISFLAWLGSLTTCTLICIFRDEESVFDFNQSGVIYLLVVILCAEHGHWVLDRIAGRFSHRTKTTGEIKAMREEYVLRRKYFGDIAEQTLVGNLPDIRGSKPPHGFWKERSVDRTVDDGRMMLSRSWKKSPGL